MDQSDSSEHIFTEINVIISGNRELNSDGHLQLKSGVMTVKRVEAMDKGQYVCVAENVLGRIQKAVSVILSGNVTFHYKRLVECTA